MTRVYGFEIASFAFICNLYLAEPVAGGRLFCNNIFVTHLKTKVKLVTALTATVTAGTVTVSLLLLCLLQQPPPNTTTEQPAAVHAHSTMSICFKVAKGLIRNPVIVMSVIGLMFHFRFKR